MFQIARHAVGGLVGRSSSRLPSTVVPLTNSTGTFKNLLPSASPSSSDQLCLVILGGVRHGSRHGGNKDYKKDFRILRDYPVGPHKTLPPNQKYDGRQGPVKNYRHIIHYPEDGRYTIRPLQVTKLGGRDPETGRKVIGRVGGGSKQKHRWVDMRRWPKDMDPEGPDLVERVLYLRYDPMRKPWIALTGYGTQLRWQIATEGMQAGDLITTTRKIPTNPIKPVSGNGYPLGALPVGTEICLVQWLPESDDVKIFHAEESVKVVRKVGDRVIIQDSVRKGWQYSLDQHCLCVAGRVSIHPLKKMHIGTPNRARWMGIAPRSGLWHRKGGTQGRKIKAPPPVIEVNEEEPEKDQKIILHCNTEGVPGLPAGKKRPFDIRQW